MLGPREGRAVFVDSTISVSESSATACSESAWVWEKQDEAFLSLAEWEQSREAVRGSQLTYSTDFCKVHPR